VARRQDTIKLNLRLPKALHGRLERVAARNDQSLNSEMIERLERSLRRDDFEKTQDAINDGMLKIIQVMADVAKHIRPLPEHQSLSALARFVQPSQQPPTDKKEDSK
jgi:Arc-like DNA binding domain